MALTKLAQQGLASASNAAGASTDGTAFAVNYGVSGIGKVTNGGTGPTIGCDFVIEVSNDGGSAWFEWSRQTAGIASGGVYLFPFGLGVGGIGGDFGHWKCSFQSNTGQAVTCQCDAESTTAL